MIWDSSCIFGQLADSQKKTLLANICSTADSLTAKLNKICMTHSVYSALQAGMNVRSSSSTKCRGMWVLNKLSYYTGLLALLPQGTSSEACLTQSILGSPLYTKPLAQA